MTATITKHLVKLPAVGNGVLAWLLTDGDQVTTGQTVARFTVESVAHSVVAPATGRLKTITPSGTTMQGGNPIGMVHEGEQGRVVAKQPTPSVSEPARRIHTEDRSVIARVESASTPAQGPAAIPTPIAEQSVPRRRGRIEPVQEPTITVLESGVAVDLPKTKKGKKKTAHTTYHVTEEQASKIASLSFLFRHDPDSPSYSGSEIVRAAVEHLLSQDRPTIEAVLGHNRERERKGKYGAGWARPNKK